MIPPMTEQDNELLTATDPELAEELETTNSITSVFVDELPTTALRVLLRDHLLWLFVGAGIAAIAFMLSPTHWFFVLARGALVLAGMGFAAIRLFQINGILVELKIRADGGSPRLRERPGPPESWPSPDTPQYPDLPE